MDRRSFGEFIELHRTLATFADDYNGPGGVAYPADKIVVAQPTKTDETGAVLASWGSPVARIGDYGRVEVGLREFVIGETQLSPIPGPNGHRLALAIQVVDPTRSGLFVLYDFFIHAEWLPTGFDNRIQEPEFTNGSGSLFNLDIPGLDQSQIDDWVATGERPAFSVTANFVNAPDSIGVTTLYDYAEAIVQ